MTTQHAVVRIDHHSAEVLQFDAEHVQSQKIKEHAHHTRKHHSAVRSEHEFFAAVCDAVAGVPEVLVAGGHQALSDFRHYVDKHRATLAPKIVGYETVDRPTSNQLVALARQYFLKYDNTAATQPPG